MYYLLGFDECIRNIFKISKKYQKTTPTTSDELKVAFRLFLNDFQPHVPYTPLSTQFVSKKETVQQLMNLYNAPSIVNDKNQEMMIEDYCEGGEIPDKISTTKKTLEILRQQRPTLHLLFNLVIHSIFFANSKLSGGGSVSSGIGVLWLNNRSHWSQQDLIELLIHEMTHTLIFIDEVANIHINDYLLVAAEENFAQSAILKQKRPVDKVYHSILVSIEVIESRLDFLGNPSSPKVHPPTEQLLRQTQQSLDSLFSIKQYEKIFSSRGQELMKLCSQRLVDINNRLQHCYMSINYANT